MDPHYAIRDPSAVFSPALLFYKDLIRRNIARAVEIAGDPARLRTHVKTHKTREIVLLEKEAGITKHKCATLVEAEMVAGCGVPDVLVAYPLVGPNCDRLAQLARNFPQCRLSVVADHPLSLQALSRAMQAHGQSVDVLVDIDVGQHRTGVAPGPEVFHLYEEIQRLWGLRLGGLHVYDGHHHQSDPAERQAAVQALLDIVLPLREMLLDRGWPVPRLVLGGTPTFPLYARLDVPGVECSPGTCFLHDHGYGSHFPDLVGFQPAALLLTRVISRPTPNRVTLDLGHKALAADPPAGERCILLDIPDARAVLHNEEHLVIETTDAARFQPGDVVYAVPTHICPTCALHRQAYVVEDGRVTGRWEIAARDRCY